MSATDRVTELCDGRGRDPSSIPLGGFVSDSMPAKTLYSGKMAVGVMNGEP